MQYLDILRHGGQITFSCNLIEASQKELAKLMSRDDAAPLETVMVQLANTGVSKW